MFWRRPKKAQAHVEESRRALEQTLREIPRSEQKDREALALRRALMKRYKANHFSETFAKALVGRDLNE